MIRVLRFDTADLRTQLSRGAIQRGTAERVIDIPLNPLPPTEVRVGATSAAPSVRATTSPLEVGIASLTSASPLNGRLESGEVALEVAGIEVGRQELAAVDRVTPLVQQAVVDTCRLPGDGECIGKRFGAEAGRDHRRGVGSVRFERVGIQRTGLFVLGDRQ